MDLYHLVVSFFLLSSSLCNDHVGAVVDSNRCKPTEKEALLLFKRNNVPDTKGVFSSWVGTDCCRDWAGVFCDNRTGHVIGLSVDTDTETYYQDEHVPTGVVPPQIGNLTHLQSLSLHGFRIEGGWIARLTSLKFLGLSYTDLQRAPDLIDNLNMLPFISEVNIYSCSSFSIPESLEHVNFTHLSSLDLEDNSVNMRMPSWLFNITSLRVLEMPDSNLSGSIPSAIGNLHNLEELILIGNQLSGSIPSAIGNLHNLQDLDLSYNELSGSIPETLGGLHHLSFLNLWRNKLTGSIPWSLRNLTSVVLLGLSYNGLNGSMPDFIADLRNLEWLHLGGNSLRGALTGDYFNRLGRLSELDLSGNPLEIRFAPDWNPPFHLGRLALSSCKVGPSFPRWIQKQSGLVVLNLSQSGISGILPTWLWDLSSITFMDLSGNNLSGTIPSKLLDMPNINSLILANNHIEGPLPQFKNAYMMFLSLSNNSFSGRIPISYCDFKGLYILDLSMNHLSGRIPQCLHKMANLEILNLASNNLEGSTEGIFNSSGKLRIVALNDNNFSGDFPSSLRMCSGLRVLNIGQNSFSGNMPTWIATSAPNLTALIASSNKLYGEIPQELQLLSKLQILDLSDNNFSGRIPHGLGNFSVMKDPSTISQQFHDTGQMFTIRMRGYYHTYSAFIIIKGQRMEYSQLLALMVLIDLSRNKLSGEIPRELSDLLGLKCLNMSHNHLVGNIPDNIGALRNVESMDLSFNNLHGEIPQSMLDMTSLVALNLSYNNLTGRIPSGSQFTTFNGSSYIGNAELCGAPLLKLCDDGESPDEVHRGIHEDQIGTVFLYLSMALGFVFGFWGLYGILWFKRTWRYAYFKVIDSMLDKIYDQATKRNRSHSQGKNIA